MHSFRLPLFLFLTSTALLRAQTNPAPSDPPPPVNKKPIELEKFVVSDTLDLAREDIVPSLGATSYEITSAQIATLSQGANAPFSQVILRAPGVAQDSSANGDLHIRGEHANLQYRINNVLLPEGISGFGLELDPRFVKSLQLVTGSLPAQYGFRTAGIVDIQTKGSGVAQGGEASLYAGSFGTIRPSFELAGATGSSSYFLNGSNDHNGLGIENPTPGTHAIHDTTDQGKLFGYFSHNLDDASRISVMVSASTSNFEVPNTPGLAAGESPNGTPWLPGTFDSSRLDENQTERNSYLVATYQKTLGELNYQLSVFGRNSSAHFQPDARGDLFFNGVASDVARQLRSGGFQGDAKYAFNDQHTLRTGAMWVEEFVRADSTTTVFPVDSNGDASGAAFPIVDNHHLHGRFAGLYLQDEWKATSRLTINYGARFDVFAASFDRESQLSPRLNFIYRVSPSTTLHAGYARYFTPPPVESVSSGTLAKFDGTSNAAATDRNDPVRAERANYFDVGISRKLSSRVQLGLDGYYKRATNQLDDGLFGQTLILSAFNYAKGEIYGAELTASYVEGGFSSYLNLAHSVAQGQEWTSSQFLFDPADAAYVASHKIHLDHDQALSASTGLSYHWNGEDGNTGVYLDALYGSGLRTSATAADGTSIPNGATVPSYYSVNIGAERTFKVSGQREWKIRLDVVNVTDKSYVLRDGAGVGVGAPQYGMRRGFFGTVSRTF